MELSDPKVMKNLAFSQKEEKNFSFISGNRTF